MAEPETLLRLICPRCRASFAICRPCFRGHVYCGRSCSQAARVETCRRARRRHRQSEAGRLDHRDAERGRRRRLRERRAARVGDQGSAEAVAAPSLPAHGPASVDEPLAWVVTWGSDAATPSRSRPRLSLQCIGCGRSSLWLRVLVWPRRRVGRRALSRSRVARD